MCRSIFLHFINRELHESLQCQFDDVSYLEILRLASIFFDVPMICNVSQVLETTDSRGPLFQEIAELSACGIIQLVASAPTISEFIESRKILYEHDRLRYPMYFNDEQVSSNSHLVLNIINEKESTTQFIAKQINDIDIYTGAIANIDRIEFRDIRAVSEQTESRGIPKSHAL